MRYVACSIRKAIPIALFGLGLALNAQQQTPPGIFTASQAEAGRASYENTCGKCHTYTLLGRTGAPDEFPPANSLSAPYQRFMGSPAHVPPLAGKVFLSRWGDKTAAQLIARFQVTASDPFFQFEGMDDDTTVNITAWVLQVNGAKPGPRPLTRTTASIVDSVVPLFLAQAAAAPIAPGTKKVNPKDGLTYVWIPPGKFQMGCSPGDMECGEDEKPVHEVTLTKGFWLGQTAVTQQAYERVTGKNPANHKGANLPVEEVNWEEARGYCAAIGGRLPTEAEYEYAARAGSTSGRYGNLDDIAWYNGNSGGVSHEVGQKLPNAWGLYDMVGNSWQWVADWYGKYTADPQTDPAGPATGDLKEPKGGSWGTAAKSLRASHRDTVEPGHRGNKLGMRCALN